MRTVMIAAPCHNGLIDVWYVSSLAETCKLGLMKNINVVPIYMSYDSLVQRARNDIVKLALESNVDDLFFIDCDQDWNPEDFFRLLDYDVNVVAAPVPKKSDFGGYNVKMDSEYIEVEENGLISVNGIGTGMMRVRTSFLRKIWEDSEEYSEKQHGKTCRNVFEVKVVDGELMSEDIVFCEKIRNLGEKVYIDPNVKCGHIGVKKWVGDFAGMIKKEE